MEFVYNDGGRSKYFKGTANDCVVRAISIIESKDYKEVYNDLHNFMKTSKKPGWVKNSSPRNGIPKQITKEYLKSLGYTWVPTMLIGQGCKIHLNANELPKGRIIASLSKHIVAIIDGILYDTYDSSRNENRCVYGYYIKEIYNGKV